MHNVCSGETNEDCTNGVDDDGDGKIDCKDNVGSGCYDGDVCGVGKVCSATNCVNECTDADADGYGKEGTDASQCKNGGGDCDDDNPRVNPGATEICWGNSDENCNGVKDCADSQCAGTPACMNCIDDEDCPSDPTCFVSGCNTGTKQCFYTAKSNVCVQNDGICCPTICGFGSDNDCENPCLQIRNTVGYQTIKFYPKSGDGIGNMMFYGTGNTINGYDARRFGRGSAYIENQLGSWPCTLYKAARSYVIFDTTCLDSSLNVTSAAFTATWTWHGTPFVNAVIHDRLYIDTSSYPNNANTWIVDPATFGNNNLKGVTGIKLRDDPNWGLGSINVPIDNLKRGDYTRFVNLISGSAKDTIFIDSVKYTVNDSEFVQADLVLKKCGYGGGLTCGGFTWMYCQEGKNRECGNSNPNLGDPCMHSEKLRDPCLFGTIKVQLPVTPEDDTYNCGEGYSYGFEYDSTGPTLDVTLCNPYYYNTCDKDDSCGKIRTTFPYNNCSLISDTLCGVELNCTDGIDNDCDGKVDGADPDCACYVLFNDCDNSFQCGGFRVVDPHYNSCDLNISNATYASCGNEKGKCTDGFDNDCDGFIDGTDGPDCPEGSGEFNHSHYRACNNSISDDNWNDTFGGGGPLVDIDDDGCCDLCNNAGFSFDAGKSLVSAVPNVGCGNKVFSAPGFQSWELGTTPFCCGDDANEFFKYYPIDNSVFGCCNSSSHCIDAEGICQLGVEETRNLCTNGKDDDCDGLIDNGDTNCSGLVFGYVFDKNRRPIKDADVKSSAPGLAFEVSVKTDYWGYYSMSDAFVGDNIIMASKLGYDENATRLDVVSKTLLPSGVQLNFTLNNGSCHADCTDSYGYCNPACEGMNFTITNSTGGFEQDSCNIINPACNYKPRGYRASYVNVTTNKVHQFFCCEGEDIGNESGNPTPYDAMKPVISGSAEDLYDYVSVVKLFNRTTKMHILVYK